MTATEIIQQSLNLMQISKGDGITITRQAMETIANELTRLQAELRALQAIANLNPDHCLCCGGDGGHLEGCCGTTGLIALEAEIASMMIEKGKLLNELTLLQAPKPAPRCPNCESQQVSCIAMTSPKGRLWYYMKCAECNNESSLPKSMEDAIDSWRPEKGTK